MSDTTKKNPRAVQAGSECCEPVYAQEAYAIGVANRMYALAVEGLGGTRPTSLPTEPQ